MVALSASRLVWLAIADEFGDLADLAGDFGKVVDRDTGAPRLLDRRTGKLERLRRVALDLGDGRSKLVARMRGKSDPRGGIFSDHDRRGRLRVRLGRHGAEHIGIPVQDGGGIVQDPDRLGHLVFEGLQCPFDELHALVCRAKLQAAFVEDDTEPRRHFLRRLTLRLRLLERAADRPSDAGEHDGLDHDHKGMKRHAAIIGAARIERARQQLIEPEMLHGDQPGGQDQDPEIAKSRQHRQNREIVKMGFDLPGMAVHQKDQQ
jgi:hypothetical protein